MNFIGYADLTATWDSLLAGWQDNFWSVPPHEYRVAKTIERTINQWERRNDAD